MENTDDYNAVLNTINARVEETAAEENIDELKKEIGF
jgi:hypothetical protein